MKQIINRMELRFPSGSVNESFARGAVSAFVLCLDPLVTDLNDLKTAVSEAVTNAIVHGYRDTIGTVYITAVIYADGTVQVKVRDRGCGIPDIEKAMEPLFTTGGEERAGLGFDSKTKKTFLNDHKIKGRDRAFMIVMVLLIAGAVVWRVMRWL